MMSAFILWESVMYGRSLKRVHGSKIRFGTQLDSSFFRREPEIEVHIGNHFSFCQKAEATVIIELLNIIKILITSTISANENMLQNMYLVKSCEINC
jgi:hypothetical protein